MFKRPFLANYLPRHHTASCASPLDIKLTAQRMTTRRRGRRYPSGEDIELCDVHDFSQLAS
ncbi:hypothetical protein HBI55_011970 [Parastagonospora nodorum]|nr:hypothetical protein HBH51_073020 [Parastagonospora nodorum]KAH5279087.1 hypothetical protein HBI71_013520 [Parastagonospora nodorum]KAH6504579.1 hypothetical protein HBI55_011970 [Parastagonospora nodorum]